MKPFGAPLSFEEAVRLITANIQSITIVETIGIDDCLHRGLAKDVIASGGTLPFNRTAVDGYAVKAKDSFSSSRHNPRIL